MKTSKCILAAVAAASLLALPAAGIDGLYVWQKGTFTRFDVGDIIYQDNEIHIGETSLNVADIDSITFLQPTVTPEPVVTDTIRITYSEDEATVTPANVEGITATIEGAAVSITNSNTDREMTFVLSGASTDGSLTYEGSYKACIRLDGISLESQSGAALDIQCGKRIALELAPGSTNSLTDAAQDFGQKAALYCKGHMEVSGGGSLTVKGNIGHAIATKEYLLLKKTMGCLIVEGAGNDGIHAGQYFQMNGGTLRISGIKGDGVQAEARQDGSEDDGQLIVKGGTLDISVTAADAAALKSDSLLTVSDGNLTINTSGDGDKALKSKADLLVSGGEMTITQSSKCVVDTGEKDKKDEDIKEDIYRLNVCLSSTTSSYWRSVYLCDANGTRLSQLTKTITVAATGQTTRTFYTYESETPLEGTFLFASDDYQSQGGGGWGGGGGRGTYQIRSKTVSGPTADQPQVYYYLNTTSYSTSGTVRTFSVTDYTSRYANGTITGTGTATTGGTDYITAAALKADGDLTITDGTITITNTGQAAKSITADGTLTVSGGIIGITNSGAGLGSSTAITTAKGLTSDKAINLEGGKLTIKMTGTGGKGIKSDGTITIGTAEGGGPQLDVATTGSRYSNSSSAKAIKAQGIIKVQGGEMTVSTSTEGAEGMESKTKATNSITISGGRHYFKCYDDCINTSGCINFDGGITVCYSNGNDAVDSNYGQLGAITIGNGTVLAYTTKGSPEEGLDCDNNSYIRITGSGLAISAGGTQGGGGGWGGSSSSGSIGSASQPYYLSTSTISYSANRYYTLADSSGNNLVTYAFPASISSSLSLFTAPGMKSGSTYTVKYSTAAPTDATTEWHGLYLGSSATGTTSVTSFTAK